VRDLGVTAISITHDIASARKISNRIACSTRARSSGTATKDIDHSGNPFVDQFIHGSAEGPIKMEVRR
jgi:phospholipid/cholesterol/gamma-HCH transport system ATP-binding protein